MDTRTNERSDYSFPQKVWITGGIIAHSDKLADTATFLTFAPSNYELHLHHINSYSTLIVATQE